MGQDQSVQLAVEGLLEGIQIIDRSWRYVYLNRTAAEHGRADRQTLLGRSLTECYPDIDRTPIFADMKYVMDCRKPLRVENLFSYPDGKSCWFELYIEPYEDDGILIRSVEITDRKRLEEQLRHAQKLEAVGQLAGGIAHEFNNKLGIMLTYTEMTLELCHDNSTAREYLNYILNAIEHSTTLTKKILAFSRKQVLELEVLSLNLLIKGMNKSLINLIGETIQIEQSLAKNIDSVRIDAREMEQVILNLCLNARDAIDRDGKITIETANVELDEDFARSHANVKPGRYVMLAVSDNGRGMDEETLARIYEPFFTTKTKDNGTGLGLSMVHGFVHQSNGHIWVYSEPGMGTVFKIYLPVVSEIPAYDRQEERKPVTTYKGKETVLLVEDDPLLRRAYELALAHAGYKVLAAGDGEEGRQVFEREKDKIQLLLTDVVLPHLKGPELAAKALELRPELKVIFMSGHTENSAAQAGLLDSGSTLLQKPISIRNLLETVRKVLDGQTVKGVI